MWVKLSNTLLNYFSTWSGLQAIFLVSMLLNVGLWLLVAVNTGLRKSKKKWLSIETGSSIPESSLLTRLKPPAITKTAALFSLVFFCCIVYARVALAAKPIVEFHRVLVYQHLSHSSWIMVKSDGPFRFDCCPDYDCASKLAAGYWAKTFKYRDMGLCSSIREDNLGVWWFHDAGTWDTSAATPQELEDARRLVAEDTIQRGSEYARSK